MDIYERLEEIKREAEHLGDPTLLAHQRRLEARFQTLDEDVTALLRRLDAAIRRQEREAA